MMCALWLVSGGRRETHLFQLLALAAAAPSAAAGELCLAADTNGNNYGVDCVDFMAHPNDWIGYREEGNPCRTPTECPQFGQRFAWTISASSADPYVVSGPREEGGALFLWYLCETGLTGPNAAEFALEGDLVVTAFTPMNGTLNAGTATQLRMAFPPCLMVSQPVGRSRSRRRSPWTADPGEA